MKLYLGVIDVPYDNKGEEGVTTGDVAKFLEDEYHIMETFYFLNEDKIAQNVADKMKGAMKSIIQGAGPSSFNPFLSATSEIEDDFKNFLSMAVMEGFGIPGVPTKASIERRSLRFKNKKKKKKSKAQLNALGMTVPDKRPSFIDTGLYQASFKVWIE